MSEKRAGIISHLQDTFYVEFREDYVLLCRNLSRRDKSKSSPHCKALILAIMERWTDSKMSKKQEAWITMTYPQWMEEMYGLFGRTTIIDSLEELVADNLLQREAYRPLRGGRDQYKYLLNSEEVNTRLKATSTSKPCKSEQDTLVDDQSTLVDDATSTSKSRSSSPTSTSGRFIERTKNHSIDSSKKEGEQPTASQGENTPSFTLTEKGSSFLERYRRQKYTVKPKAITEKVIEQANTLGEEITSDEELLSLFEYTRKLIKGENPTVFLGNMVRELPGWIQQRDSEQSNPFRAKPEPTTVKEEGFIDELVRELAQGWHEPELLDSLISEVKAIYQRAGSISDAGFEMAAREMLDAMGDMDISEARKEGKESLSAYFVWLLEADFNQPVRR